MLVVAGKRGAVAVRWWEGAGPEAGCVACEVLFIDDLEVVLN